MPPLLAPDSVTNAISRTEPVLGPKHSNTALFGTRYLLNYSDDDNDDVGSDNDCDDVVSDSDEYDEYCRSVDEYDVDNCEYNNYDYSDGVVGRRWVVGGRGLV